MAGLSLWLLINKVPDNTPEAQDLRRITINYEFSENFHYAKIERDYVNPVDSFLLSNKERLKITDVQSDFGNNYAGTSVHFDKETMTLEDVQRTRNEIKKGLPVIPGAKISVGGSAPRPQVDRHQLRFLREFPLRQDRAGLRQPG